MNTLFFATAGASGTREMLINLAYIGACVLFILGIKMLGKADTARRGNFISSMGMLTAVVAVMFDSEVVASGVREYGYLWLAGGLALGALIGLTLAMRVKMTGMPEMVALLNGLGGLASLLVAWAEFVKFEVFSVFGNVSILVTIIIGGITFSGSLLAYGKLSEKISGRPFLFKGQHIVNGALVLGILACLGIFSAAPLAEFHMTAFYVAVGLALVIGVTAVMPIGGGDMPVVISLLNSLSGMAAAAAGFVLLNNVLIVAGCLVGASGIILTIIMCKAMNRSIGNLLFSGFGSASSSGSAKKATGEPKALSAADAFLVLEAARSVVVIPGYGMAVAQAQHVVKELGEKLEENGAEVKYAIHPVAGRMPGHMNVLLAEADVPYEQLCEMDAVNPTMGMTDVAIVIGANDVVNPAAATDKGSPIYGMPIIKAHEAKTVFVLKRGKGTGFSGIENELFLMPNTRMIYGDAKATITALVAEFGKL